MLLLRKMTGKVYKAFRIVGKPKIHIKLASLELDSILFITLQVGELWWYLEISFGIVTDYYLLLLVLTLFNSNT